VVGSVPADALFARVHRGQHLHPVTLRFLLPQGRHGQVLPSEK